jgi:hypothetical protein
MSAGRRYVTTRPQLGRNSSSLSVPRAITQQTRQQRRIRRLKRKYDELQKQQTSYEELFNLLKAVPESNSLEILRRIRAGADVGSAVRHAKDGNLLLQLS